MLARVLIGCPTVVFLSELLCSHGMEATGRQLEVAITLSKMEVYITWLANTNHKPIVTDFVFSD
jgi:hypothetical protein